MLGILYLVLIVFASFLIVRRAGGTVFSSGLETLAVAIASGIAGSSLLASGLAILLPQGAAAGIVLGMLLIAGAICWASCQRQGILMWPKFAVPRSEKLWYAGVVIIVGGFLTFLVLGTLRLNSDRSVNIPRQASVDVVYHLSQIERVALAANWHFEEPNFSGEFIRYPYLINLFSGVMVKFGAPLSWAYHAPIILLIFALLFGFLRLCRELGLTKLLSVLALVLVFFGSGVAYLLGYDFNAGPLAVAYPQQHINYAGFIAGFFTVQRAFMLGLPLLIFSVLSFVRGIKEDNLTALKWSGVLFGLLPFAHSHSFFAGGIFYGVALLYYIIRYIVRRDPIVFDIVRGTVFYGTAVAIVPLLCMLLLPQYNLGGVPALRLGWMSDPKEIGGLNLAGLNSSRLQPWLLFMLGNFGALLLLPLMALSGILRRLGPVYWVAMLAGLALWIFPNIVQLQTWDYDTNKLFVYAILFSALAASMVVGSWNGWTRKLGLGVLIAIVISSLPIPILKLRHMIASERKEEVTIFTPEQQLASAWIRQNTNEGAVIISSAANPSQQSLLNGAVIGSGRTATIGYITWLYTHGIDYEERLQKVQQFFQTGDLGALSDIPADYFILDGLLKNQYPALQSLLQKGGLAPVYQNNSLSIYKLK
jgi:hypothetical protein